MVLEQPWAQKRMFWAFEKSIFQFFATFWVSKLKAFSGKFRQRVQIYFSQNLGIKTFLQNGFGPTLRPKTNFVSVWKKDFTVFGNFWVTKLKRFSGQLRQSVENYLNQNLGIRIFSENSFGETLSSKTNVVSVWKMCFPVFYKFLSDELQTISEKVTQSIQNYLNQNLDVRTFLENGFGATLTSKTNGLGVWKKAFFSFL